MPAAKVEVLPNTDLTKHSSFFRQSGWLMIANIAGGMLMWAVHFLSRTIGPTEYGVFGVFLAIAMCVPTLPLQMVLTQQTARALATGREREVAGMIRIVWLGTFVLWLVACLLVVILRNQILGRLQIEHPLGLWITMGVLLLSLWLPIFWGVLQGQQNFLWLGWSMMLNAFGRLSVATIAVIALTGFAAGIMAGVFSGMALAVIVAAWQTRSLWATAPAPFDWRSLLREVLPPMLGFAAFQFLFTADTVFVKSYFAEAQTGFYFSAGTLSRALMWLVGPLASVMFPKIVHSTAKSEKTNLVNLVLLGTGILSVLGAISMSILGPWIVRFVSGKEFVSVASSLLPWYAGAMVPLALANVLLNNLLAKSSFKIVVPLCLLAIAYGFALTRFHETLVMVLQILGLFNLVLLLLCGWFTWTSRPPENPNLQIG